MSGLEATLSTAPLHEEAQEDSNSTPVVLSSKEYYAATAFDSRDIPELEPAVYEKDTQQWPSLSLPWEKRPDPAKIRRCIAFGSEGIAPEKSANMVCTERFLYFTMRSIKLHPVFVFVAQLYIAYLLGVGIYFWAGGGYIEMVWGASLILFLFVLGCLFLRHEKHFTFDRKVGTLTEGNPEKKTGTPILFYECDPFIMSTRKDKERPVYQLGMRPRAVPHLREPWIIYEAVEKEDIYIMWHFIQMFMDCSRPLPDIPALELYRSRDPRTVRYDKRHRREAEYWAWKAPEERFMLYNKAVQRFPDVEALWPCVLARRIPGRNPEEPIHVRPN